MVDELSKASSVALNTDRWTSRATDNRLTANAHYTTEEWAMQSLVLQSRFLYESHTGTNKAQVVLGVVTTVQARKAPYQHPNIHRCQEPS